MAFLVSRRVVLFGVRFDDDDDEIFDAQSARIFCWGEKEREKGERDRCEGWMTVQTHKT